ncbi:MAG: NUDIX domain-containing protein [Opitutales bacterium]
MERPAQRGDELFDIVDGEDRVVGQATRAEVHAQGLWHRAVHILVFDASGRFLLQRRSRHKDTFPGTWTTSCAGHLDSGEDYAGAAIRELAEEVGVGARPGDLMDLGKSPPSPETGWEWIRVYAIVYNGFVAAEPAEVAELRWVEPEELDQWMKGSPNDFAPSFRLVWHQYAWGFRNQTGIQP